MSDLAKKITKKRNARTVPDDIMIVTTINPKKMTGTIAVKANGTVQNARIATATAAIVPV
jgi:hypothetical protein